MPLTIIAGRAGSGKSAKIYNKINELSDKNINSVLLVPEQSTLQAERELITSGNGKGFITTNVMSISRLALEIFSTVSAPLEKFIDERGKAAVLSTVSHDILDELKVFGRAASFSGFASETAQLISDFKRNDITPKMLLDASSSFTGLSSDKIQDVSKIYSAFNKFLKEKHYIDAEDTRDILSITLANAKQYTEANFFMDGFDSFTSQDIKIAKAILNLSGKLTITINCDKNSKELIFSSGRKALEDLQSMAKSIGQNSIIEFAYNPHVKKHPSILHLEQNLFAESPKIFNRVSEIKTYVASSEQQEVEHIACEILSLIKDNNSLRYKDISILCCADLNIYSQLFERMFLRYKIPCFTHRRKSIAEHPAISYILSAITTKIFNTQQSDVITMLKSGYSNIICEDAMLFEDYVLDNAIDGYLFGRELKRGKKKYDLDKINLLCKNLLAPTHHLSNKKLPANTHLKNIFKMIQSANIKESLMSEREELVKNNALSKAAMTSQVYNSIISILEQLNVLFEDKIMSLEQLLLAFEESFISTQIGILPVTSDEVIIGELGRSKLSETKHLFVVGASENNLPPLNSQNPILSDSDIESLSRTGINLTKSISSIRTTADYGIYQAFSLPSNGLYVSYPATSSNGVSTKSLILKQVEEIFGLDTQKATIDYKASTAAALTVAAKAFGAIGDGRIPPDNWKQAVSALINKGMATAEFSKMKMFLSSIDKAKDITPKKNGVIISSVSQIENYAGCPFSYMVNYSLSPADDPGEEITPAGEGAFLHEAMERLGDALLDYDISSLDDSAIEEIMEKEAEIIAQNFDNQQLSRDAKGKYTASQLIKTAKHGATIYSKHMNNSKFIPVGQEIAFSEGKDLGPIEITLESGTKVQIGGKVDRLDTYTSQNEKYARIIDYKSSVKKIDYSKIESGRQLQLLIYMDAYLNKNDNVKASGVFYFPIKKPYINEDKNEKRNDKMQGLFINNPNNIEALDKDIKELGTSELINAKYKKDGNFDSYSDNISAEGFNKILSYAKNKAKDTLCQMDEGNIPVRPASDGKESQCKYCEYSSICKKDISIHDEQVELDKKTAKKIILGEQDG